jgi:hypothetical protein
MRFSGVERRAFCARYAAIKQTDEGERTADRAREKFRSHVLNGFRTVHQQVFTDTPIK